jgi:hypothetical protein
MFDKPLLSGLPNVFYNRCNSQKPNSNYNKLITKWRCFNPIDSRRLLMLNK